MVPTGIGGRPRFPFAWPSDRLLNFRETVVVGPPVRQPGLEPSHRVVTFTVPFARILGIPDPAEALARRPVDLTDTTVIMQEVSRAVEGVRLQC